MTIESQLHRALAKMTTPRRAVIKAGSVDEARQFVETAFKNEGFRVSRSRTVSATKFSLEVVQNKIDFYLDFATDLASIQDDGDYLISFTLSSVEFRRFCAKLHDAIADFMHRFQDINLSLDSWKEYADVDVSTADDVINESVVLRKLLLGVQRAGSLDQLNDYLVVLGNIGKVIKTLAKRIPN